jgi:hypothetical protein
MNIFIHEDYKNEERRKIKKRRLIGVGLFALALAMSLASFTPETALLSFLSWPILLIGFPIWSSANAADTRLKNAPRTDSLINDELRGLNNKYSLHHYPRVGDVWIPELMITLSGLIVFASNGAMGPVSCKVTAKGDTWKSPTNLMDRMTGTKPPIGNPTVELDAMVAAARGLLASIGKPDVPVKGIALFTRNPEITLDGCSYGAAPLNEMRDAVRDLEVDMGANREEGLVVNTILTSEDRKRLNNLLAPVSIPASAAVAEKPAKSVSVRR